MVYESKCYTPKASFRERSQCEGGCRPWRHCNRGKVCTPCCLESSLREVLFNIIKFVNEKRDHIPPVSNLDVVFPYEMTIPSSSDPSFGMGDMFKGMLQTGHPAMLS